MTSSDPTTSSNRFDSVLDSVRVYLMGKGAYGFAGKLLTVGSLLYGDQSPLAIQLLAILASSVGANISQLEQSHFSLNFLSIIMICSGLIIGLWNFVAPKIRSIKQLVIEASYQPIASALMKNLIDPNDEFWVLPFKIDLCSNSMATERDVKAAINLCRKRVKSLKETRETFYAGIAHIPIVAFTGFLLRNFKVSFLEIDHYTKEPIDLRVSQQEDELVFNSPKWPEEIDTEVIFAISISYPISDEQIIRSVGPDRCVLKFQVENPALSNLRSQSNLEKLARSVRNEIDKTVSALEAVKRIKILYAGPTSFIFRVAQLVSENTDPEVSVFHYSREECKYTWGIVINKGGRFVQLSQ